MTTQINTNSDKMIISKNMEVPFMDLDINKAVGAAQDAIGAVAKDENAKKVANDAIDKVEKKVGVDLPDVDAINNAIGKK